jgi:hypothetical protein
VRCARALVYGRPVYAQEHAGDGGDVGARRAWLERRRAVIEAEGSAVRAAIPSELVLHGRALPAAQLVRTAGQAEPTSLEPAAALAVGTRLLDALRARGARAVYAVPSREWPERELEQLGLRPAFELCLRNFYLSMGALSGVLEERGPHPLRKVATFARRIRQKMVEVDLTEGWLGDAARVSAERQAGLGLAVVRDAAYLAWRYTATPHKYRMLVLRRAVGAGIDGYAIVEPLPADERGGCMRVVDHWSRSADRVGDSRFMFELALWFLSEHVSVVQALGVPGSALDGLFMRTGGFKKAWSGALWWRALDGATPMPSASAAALRASDLVDLE